MNVSIKEELLQLLDSETSGAWDSMSRELNTDENADYRRGFRAGRLVASLELKADISNLMLLEGQANEL
jgi:hypothetical protein